MVIAVNIFWYNLYYTVLRLNDARTMHFCCNKSGNVIKLILRM